MSALQQRVVSNVEYLTLDRSSDQRFELDDGEVFPVEAATREHNLIMANVLGELRQQLKGRSCEAYVNAMRVATSKGTRYCYPDIVVVCGEPEFEDRQGDTLLNPTVLFEVLSKSTAWRDRGRKFELYRSVKTVQQYVMIDQDRPHLEVYERTSATHWSFYDLYGIDSVLTLPPIGCSLTLAEIYERVTFPEPTEDDDGELKSDDQLPKN